MIKSSSMLTRFSYKSAQRLIIQLSRRFLPESRTASLHFNNNITRYLSTMTQTTFVKHALEDNEIVKSAQDKREYRALELTNGMKVMLISDPETDKSSAALDVNVGHMCDPTDLPGLAHFCEHMLFLGTEKFPVENEYNKFLSEHGGSANAFTSAEHTNFYFEVAPDHLPGALDRFAQFFLSPLFTESATEREVNAVHSENDKNLQSDPWRLHQLEKSTADPKHDYSKFGTGNKFTLETRPKELGLNVRDELLKFHAKYYSSNIMALAVLGKESLDTLSELVLPMFSGVTNKQLSVPEWLQHPYGAEQLKMQAHIVPVKDIRTLNILWPTADLHQYYASSPGHYLGHLIGHEGPGSLLSELKARGWVNALVGGQKSGAKGFMFFMVNVDLTEDGIEHTDDIVTLMFQYINMLKAEGPQEWVFKECQDLSAMTFRFKDKEKPSSYTSMVAGLLQDYPLKEVLCGPYVLHEFRQDLIEMVLDKLTLESLRIGIVAKQFEGMTDEKEYWYGTDYSIKPIPTETIEKWRTCGCHENLKLPPRNEFIPTNFEITSREKDAPSMPELIKDDVTSRIWFKQDDTFLLPKACMNFELRSPLVYQDPVYMNMTFLMAQLVKDALNEYAYAAELSGLTYALESTIYGLFFQVKGYSDKQAVLLQKVIEKVTAFEVDPQRYEIIKELYTRSLQNFKAEQPHQHAVYYTSVLMAEQVWTNDEMLDALQDVTLEKLKAFISQLFSKIYIEGLVYGNITKQSAVDAITLIETTLRERCCTKSLLSSQHRRYRELQLPDGCYYVYRQENEVHRSCCLEIYYQTGMQGTHSNVLLELFCQVIAEPCFSVLRTKEQLGYIVFSGIRRSSGVQGLRVIVQSDRKPEYVETRIEAFLHSMEACMRDMSTEDFEKHVEALATKKLEKPKMLSMQNKRYWSEIISQQYNFDRDDLEVADLRTLSKDDLIKFYKTSIGHDAPLRHKVCVYITSSAEGNPETITPSESLEDGLLPVPPMPEPSEVSDVMNFKRGLALYPLARPFIDLSKAKSKL